MKITVNDELELNYELDGDPASEPVIFVHIRGLRASRERRGFVPPSPTIVDAHWLNWSDCAARLTRR